MECTSDTESERGEVRIDAILPVWKSDGAIGVESTTCPPSSTGKEKPTWSDKRHHDIGESCIGTPRYSTPYRVFLLIDMLDRPKTSAEWVGTILKCSAETVAHLFCRSETAEEVTGRKGSIRVVNPPHVHIRERHDDADEVRTMFHISPLFPETLAGAADMVRPRKVHNVSGCECHEKAPVVLKVAMELLGAHSCPWKHMDVSAGKHMTV